MTRATAGGEPPCQRRFCGRTRTRRARSGRPCQPGCQHAAAWTLV